MFEGAVLAVNVSVWAAKQLYYGGSYLIWGHQETVEEKTLRTVENLQKKIDQLEIELKETKQQPDLEQIVTT